MSHRMRHQCNQRLAVLSIDGYCAGNFIPYVTGHNKRNDAKKKRLPNGKWQAWLFDPFLSGHPSSKTRFRSGHTRRQKNVKDTSTTSTTSSTMPGDVGIWDMAISVNNQRLLGGGEDFANKQSETSLVIVGKIFWHVEVVVSEPCRVARCL